jgi:hypothetical protein
MAPRFTSGKIAGNPTSRCAERSFWMILGSTPVTRMWRRRPRGARASVSAGQIEANFHREDHDGEFQQPSCERLSGRDAEHRTPGTGVLPEPDGA